MAHLLNAEEIGVGHGARVVLDGVSLGLDDGDRVGVLGRNGAGKSTLIRVLAKLQEPDGGRVTHARGLQVGALQQDDVRSAGTVRDAVLGQRAEFEWAGEPAVRDVLAGLLGDLAGAGVGGLDTPLEALSGGQRRRVGLASVLVGEPDLVVLDEPTNHLDVEGVAWLAAHLRRRWPAGRGGLLVVTHDRWFLDAVCDRIWEVHDAVVDGYDGGYSAYVLARAERARVAAVTEGRRQNLLRKELAWLRRGPPARTSKPRFRIEAANALIADEPPPRDSVALARMATRRLGKDVVDLEDVTLDLGGRRLLDGVTWRLGPGDRVALVGVNGAGKTSLLRLVTGALAPDAGRVRRGKTVEVAMLSQDLRELDDVAGLRVAEAVERVRGSIQLGGPMGGKEVTAGQLLERLGFDSRRSATPVADLSGGERRRLQLLRLLMAEPNVLLLDEPTNDLDTDMLAEVEDTLDGWPGTLVVVSHDRYLLERVCDRMYALPGDGSLRDLPGGVEEYLSLRASIPTSRADPTSPVDQGIPRDQGNLPAEVRAARKEMQRLERQIAKLTAAEEKLHAELAEKATDHEAVLRLDGELRDVVRQREALEEEWLAAAELTE